MLISCYCHTQTLGLCSLFFQSVFSLFLLLSPSNEFSVLVIIHYSSKIFIWVSFIYSISLLTFCFALFLSVYYCFLDHSCNSCFCTLFQVIPTSLSYWHLLVIFSHTSWTFPVLFLFLIFVRQVVLDCFLVFWIWCMYFWALFKFYGKHCYYTFSS